MTQPFPLYDRLVTQVALPGWDWKRVCATINGLPDEHMPIIYSLILHHAHLNGQPTTLPYGGRLPDGKKGILYTGNHLPVALQAIITAYVQSL